MKIVLRQDVPKLGEAGTIQNVKPGFARNYLIPQGFAVLATPGEVKTAEHNLEVKARKIAKQEAQLQTLADKIAGKRLEFTVRAGESGRLYGSITAGDIADELAKIAGEEIDRRKVVLEDPIRQLGEHSVTVHLIGRLRPAITVVAVGDAEYQEAMAMAAKAAGDALPAPGDKPEKDHGAKGHPEPGVPHHDGVLVTTEDGPEHEWVDEGGVPGAHGEILNAGGPATVAEEVGKAVPADEVSGVTEP